MAQSVDHPTLVWAQIMISWVCEFKPHVGLCADTAELDWDLLSAPPPLVFFLSLSLKINKF